MDWSWLSSLFNSSSSAAGSAMQYARNQSLMKYQFELNQRSLRESPSAMKQGLLDAGYNPMLALNGSVNAPSVGGSSVSAPDLRPDFSSAFTAKKERELIETQKDDFKSSAKLKRTQEGIAKAQSAADIALKTAQAEKIRRESDSVAPPARKAHDYISAGKDVVAPILSAAATAYGAKKGVEIATKAMKSVGIRNAREVAKESVRASVAHSAKSALGSVGKTASKVASPAVGYYGGKYGESVSRRLYENQRGKSWSTIFSKRPLTH